jgi:hypothetical protein
MINISELDVVKTVTHFTKNYPKTSHLYEYNTNRKIVPPGWEQRNKRKKYTPPDFYKNKSLTRAKTKLTDLILCNEFDLFCTFTFNSNRQDINTCKKTMSKWLNNQQTQYGNFNYLIVPEYHHDNISIHFHALFGGYKGQLIKSSSKHKNKNIYNIKSYKKGFTTAEKINSLEKTAHYVAKYITKEMPQFNAKKRYWHSNNLKKPVVAINPIITFDEHNQYSKLYNGKYLTSYIKDLSTVV